MKLQNLKDSYTVCIIRCDEISSGSGFLVEFSGKRFVITDYHVLYNNKGILYHSDCTLSFTIQNDSYNTMVMFRLDLENTNIFTDSDLDVAAIELTSDNSTVEIGNIQLSHMLPLLLNTVSIPDIWGQDCYLYGHPTSLNREAPFDMKPFLTTGIISSYDEDLGKFITNIPAFYGNSGGPVLYKTENGDMMIIGIVQKLIHFCLDWRNRYEREAIRNDWQNSGYSICLNVNKIISFLDANVTHK